MDPKSKVAHTIIVHEDKGPLVVGLAGAPLVLIQGCILGPGPNFSAPSRYPKDSPIILDECSDNTTVPFWSRDSMVLLDQMGFIPTPKAPTPSVWEHLLVAP